MRVTSPSQQMIRRRPRLCRLCHFPAVDGGVRASLLNEDKLSEWCLQRLDTLLDAEGAEKAAFCQFCVWDARFEFENSELEDGRPKYAWWDTFGSQDWIYNYYLEEKLRPCSVRVSNLSKKVLKKYKISIQDCPDSDEATEDVPSPSKKVSSTCPYCAQTLDTQKSYVQHVRSVHADMQTFFCHPCLLYFRTAEERDTHVSQRHQRKCLYCDIEFLTFSGLSKHVRTHHPDASIQCKYNGRCASYFRTHADRREHVRTVHESGADKAVCICCAKSVRVGLLRKHIWTHHGVDIVFCTASKSCKAYFLSEVDRLKHVAEAHQMTRMCVYCRKGVAASRLSSHMRNCHSSEAIKCNFHTHCPTYFLSGAERDMHVREKHHVTKAHAQTIHCVYCGHAYSDKRSLGSHMRNVHAELRLKCSSLGCPEYFLSEIERDTHFRTVHSKAEVKKVFKCCLCPFRSANAICLKVHVARRHGPDDLGCPECPKRFKAKMALQIHRTKYHNAKPKECPNCGESVVDLRSHLKSVQCVTCGQTTSCAGQRRTHNKTCMVL